MKISVKTMAIGQLLCTLASPATSSEACHPNQVYKGGDLLSLDPTFETFLMSQLEYWSTMSQAQGLVATKDNIYKSFFNCTSDGQLVLVHWCACGIDGIVNATTGVKTGDKCVMPCSVGSKATESTSGSSSIPVLLTAVGAAAVLFAAGSSLHSYR
ncbi:hypothetical protein CONLIGDRAFT_687483 [Coniochaeta ligniaria NRRL 30616]|uniref:WSC domain-containing protein n=1 Tax=Coniochaeta ligniaria NRRL 30616 TaxID=1408157 RepID=A0A1J7I4T3_9PEZI|nr:hypothetical protein CONLIGDRAFT_687483 [Coniochaeta ligniaria NRRL 30616]